MKKGEKYQKFSKPKDGMIRFRGRDEDFEKLWKLQQKLDTDMSTVMRVALSVACKELKI